MRQPIKFGKYLLLERIAVGGMAEVFVAKAFGVEGFERLLAIKKILPTMGEDGEFISMFVDEARIAVQLSHANIVQVLELGKHEDNLYIAMEYISGRDLRQVIERFRKRQISIPLPQACLMVAEVCEALDYAHRKRDTRGQPLGIVHRDVSPQNVLVSFDGEVKLIDFGIAKAESRLQKTQAGILKGKFSYMSPEQVRGQSVDGRSDIFAAGILLWELICGEKLFTGDSDFAILEKVRNGTVPLPRTINRNCPEALERVMMKALTSEPRDRYQSASELHDDLMRFTVLGDMVYGSRQLAEWLREEFKVEHEKEQDRLRGWLGTADLAEVTPAEQVRRPPPFGMVASGNLGITPMDPFPGPAVQQAAEQASSEPTQQWRIAPDQDTLALPPTPPGGLVAVVKPAAPAHEQELPTMKMDGEALIQAERELAARKAAAAGGVLISQSIRLADADAEESTSIDDQKQAAPPVPAPRPPPPSSRPPPPGPRPTPAAVKPVASITPLGPPPTQVVKSLGAVQAPMAFDMSDERTGAPRNQRKQGLSKSLKEQAATPAAPNKTKRVAIGVVALLVLLVVAGLWFVLAPDRAVRPGKVVIALTPSVTADFFIDGKPSGQLPPFVHTVPAGKHKLEVRAEGYKSFTTQVQVPSGGKPLEVEAQLQPEGPMQVEGVVLTQPRPTEEKAEEPPRDDAKKKTWWTKKEKQPARKVAVAEPAPAAQPDETQQPTEARLRVVTEPAGADITVDGKPVGKSPVTTGPLDTGPYHPVVATLDGYAPARRATKVDLGLNDLKLTLAAREPEVAESGTGGGAPAGVGYLTAATKPEARLTIDGRDTGRWTPVPPANPIALPAGAHTIVFETRDGRRIEENLNIEAGKTARLIRSLP